MIGVDLPESAAGGYNRLVPTASKWIRGAAAAVHVARRTPHGRVAGAVLAGARAAAASFLKALHLLFLEVTGFIFLCFAAVGGFACWREYQQFAADRIGPAKPIVAAAFTAMFLWFGLSSFWRARVRKK